MFLDHNILVPCACKYSLVPRVDSWDFSFYILLMCKGFLKKTQKRTVFCQISSNNYIILHILVLPLPFQDHFTSLAPLNICYTLPSTQFSMWCTPPLSSKSSIYFPSSQPNYLLVSSQYLLMISSYNCFLNLL